MAKTAKSIRKGSQILIEVSGGLLAKTTTRTIEDQWEGEQVKASMRLEDFVELN